MSDVQVGTEAFFDLFSRGQVSADAIDDFVEAWHTSGEEEDRPLSDFLGMTEDEYAVWVMDARTLPLILSVRQSGGSLPLAVAGYVDDMRAAANPIDGSAIWALSRWATRHGGG